MITSSESAEKPWYQSKTQIGAILTFLCLILSAFGFEITDKPMFLEENTKTVLALGGAMTTALTVYGRFVASSKLIVRGRGRGRGK